MQYHFLFVIYVPAQYPRPIGIEYLGTGYDIVYGNPYEGAGSDSEILIDPGFRMNVIQLAYAPGHVEARFTAPYGVRIKRMPMCNRMLVSQAISTIGIYIDRCPPFRKRAVTNFTSHCCACCCFADLDMFTADTAVVQRIISNYYSLMLCLLMLYHLLNISLI